MAPDLLGERSEPEHVRENAAAVDITLTGDDLAAIDQVAPVGIAAGERYAPGGMQAVHR